jgi:putative SOS response-associated peptidase YedK
MEDSATIIVGPANEWMSRFHNRMPVVLSWNDAGTWMTGDDSRTGSSNSTLFDPHSLDDERFCCTNPNARA